MMMNPRSRERGGALLISVVALMAILAMMVAYLQIAMAYGEAVVGGKNREHALLVAEAGLDYAVDQMNHWQTGDPALSTLTQSLSGGSFDVTISPTFSGTAGSYVVTSTGTHEGESRMISLVLESTAGGGYRFAVFSDESFVVDSNADVDSFDSDPDDDPATPTETWNVQAVNRLGSHVYANTKGDIGSNGSITLDSNSAIFGNVVPGPTGSVKQGSGVKVTGTTTPNTQKIVLPDVVLPAAKDLPGQKLITKEKEKRVLAAGEYHFSSFQTVSNSSVTINGPAVLVIDDFQTSSNCTLLCDVSGGPVEIYGTGRFLMDSNTSFSSTSKLAGDLRINIATDTNVKAVPVGVSSNVALYAVINAPKARVVLDSNGDLYGSIAARALSWSSNFSVHYDESLGTTDAGPGTLSSKGWIELPPTTVLVNGVPTGISTAK